MDSENPDLTFALVDDLALATVRRRINSAAYLGAVKVGRVGPFLELLSLCRANIMGFDALPPGSPAIEALLSALKPDRQGIAVCAGTSESGIGFITTNRDPQADDQVHWVAFCRKAQEAAEPSLPKPIAQGLIGAMREIEENVHLHSERAFDGVVGFRGTKDEFEFAVMDSIADIADTHAISWRIEQ